jgi:quinol monooxygenase YgiN
LALSQSHIPMSCYVQRAPAGHVVAGRHCPRERRVAIVFVPQAIQQRAEQIHAISLASMHGEFATVIETAALLARIGMGHEAALSKSASSPSLGAAQTRVLKRRSRTREGRQKVASQVEEMAQTCCPIVEFRQYTLRPGQRDALIELFDREFVESQEAVGMQIIGQFRDLDDPDRFVWLRGFPDMDARAGSLGAFYDGPVWLAHRDTANATMVDSDNVLLLRQARPSSGFVLEEKRPPRGAAETPAGLVAATICRLDPAAEDDFVAFFEGVLAPTLADAGATILASFVAEHSPNTFPRLPVREGEAVFVWFMRFSDLAAYERHRAALAQSPRWRTEIAPALARCVEGTPEVRRLSPTARSRLRA